MRFRSLLYAPGNNAKLLERVFGAGPDAVILDLEDAVPAAEKTTAREMVAAKVAEAPPGPALFVRINALATGLAEADVAAVARAGLAGLHIPKVERAEDVRRVAGWLDRAGSKTRLICIIESALGIWNAREIASAHERVLALGFGQADIIRDLGVEPGPDGLELLYARSRLVLASRVAGINPPIDSVHTNVQDEDGLRQAAQRARALGFSGKSAIHPRQVPIINEVFAPSQREIELARRIIAQYKEAEAAGSGAFQLDGELIDTAMVRRAEDVLRLAEEVQS